MNFLIYFLSFLITLYFWYQKKFGLRNELLSKFPAPKSYPILRHGALLFGKSPPKVLETITKLAAKYRPIWRLDITMLTSQIFVQDPKIVEEILTSQKFIDKSNGYNLLINWLGTGLLISSGKKWQQRRKIITPTFHFKMLEPFVDIMDKHGDVLIKKLKQSDGHEVDIFSMASLYALDVICECAMSYELNAQLNEKSEYVMAVQEISSIFFEKIFNPKMRIYCIYRFTEMYKREQYLIKKSHEFTDSVIAARRKYLNTRKTDEDEETTDDFGMKKKTAFLDLLLQIKVEGEPLDHASIREEVDTFMFEGHDTTSSAIAFTFLNLAKYPDIQEKVYEECQEVLKDSSTMQDLNQLSYLDKVIKETLRLYPSVPSFSRKFKSDEKIGGFTFPANVSVQISVFQMGRDPNLFPNPLKFDPSRFDHEEGNIKLFSFVPFSAGPRNCIGQRFAMLELKSIISKVVKNFKLSITKENENPIMASELILRPINGIKINIKSR